MDLILSCRWPKQNTGMPSMYGVRLSAIQKRRRSALVALVMCSLALAFINELRLNEAEGIHQLAGHGFSR